MKGIACGLVILSGLSTGGAEEAMRALPAPEARSDRSLEEVLRSRRSIRRFTHEPLDLREIAQLCWAAQGVTDARRGFRTAPSAGGTFPLELYLVTENSVWHYDPQHHRLKKHVDGDLRTALRRACLDQPWVESAPVVFIIAADIGRTARRYGPRAERYVLIEVGHAAQNLLLQAEALGLGAVPVGAYDDDQVHALLKLPKEQRVFYVIPVGKPRP